MLFEAFECKSRCEAVQLEFYTGAERGTSEGAFNFGMSATHSQSFSEEMKERPNLSCRSRVGSGSGPCGSDCTATLARSKTSDCSFEKHGPPNILDNSSSASENKPESKREEVCTALRVYVRS